MFSKRRNLRSEQFTEGAHPGSTRVQTPEEPLDTVGQRDKQDNSGTNIPFVDADARSSAWGVGSGGEFLSNDINCCESHLRMHTQGTVTQCSTALGCTQSGASFQKYTDLRM